VRTLSFVRAFTQSPCQLIEHHRWLNNVQRIAAAPEVAERVVYSIGPSKSRGGSDPERVEKRKRELVKLTNFPPAREPPRRNIVEQDNVSLGAEEITCSKTVTNAGNRSG
jgi:hypothetical protein